MKLIAAVNLLLMLMQPTAGYTEVFDRAQIESEVMAVLDEFIRAFSASDPIAHVATYHFPHYRLARGEMSVWEDENAAVRANKAVFESLPATGWARSTWIERRIVTMSDTKVHVATRFRRLREDGTEIGTYDSLYILIRKDGKWGIKMRSSFL
jgi:hypothetical protein